MGEGGEEVGEGVGSGGGGEGFGILALVLANVASVVTVAATFALNTAGGIFGKRRDDDARHGVGMGGGLGESREGVCFRKRWCCSWWWR